MRFKKGFTLAEILIVLMVIGALATMTIPSLIKGVQEAQYKTAYKKALNAIVNLTAMEKVSGNLPARANAAGANRLFDSLASSLSVKAYVKSDNDNTGVRLGSGAIPNISSDNVFLTTAPTGDTRYQYWIVTDDNIAYLITQGKSGNANCGTKLQISGNQSDKTSATAQDAATAAIAVTADTLADNACYVVYIDVNGLTSGPNTIKTNFISKDSKLPVLDYDTFPIYVGSDGSTAGSERTTVTGRIATDLK